MRARARSSTALAQGRAHHRQRVQGTAPTASTCVSSEDGKTFSPSTPPACATEVRWPTYRVLQHGASRASIRRAEVVLHFFDARLKISRVDKQLTDYILEHRKPAIFVVNKWDLLKDDVTMEEFTSYIKRRSQLLDYVPISYVTAKSGKNVYKLLNLAEQLVKQANARTTTGELNRILHMAVESNPPTAKMGRLPKIFYATQASVAPPTIIIFVNGPHLFEAHLRALSHEDFRLHLPFSEVPIKLEFRSRHGRIGRRRKLRRAKPARPLRLIKSR